MFCYSKLIKNRLYSTSFFVLNKDKAIHLFFKLNKLDNYSYFLQTIISNLKSNTIYTVYVKIISNQDNFYLAGNQFGFNYKSNSDITLLYDNVIIRLEDYFSSYNLDDDDILYIQLSFSVIDKKIYSKLKLDNKFYLDLDKLDDKDIFDYIVVTKIIDDINLISNLNDKINLNDNNVIKDLIETKKITTTPVTVNKDSLGKKLNVKLDIIIILLK